ncbi:MAG: aspartyl-phosphate phosphatase Spo0E family protein [Bacillaceae bacterium]|nr:aspartyl-phosphate phosphatase Spo0E family protein [Bacillaceae bacterium]
MKSIKNNGIRTLKEKISKKQEEMYKTADEFGIRSKNTLTISQELDYLINMYLKTKIEEAKKV